MRTRELQRLTVKELHNLAEKFKVENFSGLRKQDLIREILEKQAKFVYLALGSNLGNRINNIEKAKQLLHKYNVNVIKSSSYYETKSWPNINFPKYFNISSGKFKCNAL